MPPVNYPILDPFHRRLYKTLSEELDSRIRSLLGGSAFPVAGEVQTTGEKYARNVGYIECMNTVIELCREIETEMMGGKPSED